MSVYVGTQTCLDTFLTAVRTGLVARAGLAGVNVYTGPIVDEKELGNEYIMLGWGSSNSPVSAQYYYVIGTPEYMVSESLDVPCELLGVETGVGETGIISARQRGLAILNEVHQWLKANDTGSGLVKVDRYKPRTALYTLQTDALSFDQTKSGDLVLPEGTNITFSIPQDAENIYFSSPPQNIADEGAVSIHNYSGKTRQFTWNGDLLPNFQFTYEIESPLEDEVIGFFADSQNDVMGFFFGPEGLAAIFLMATAVVSAYCLNKVNSK